MLEIKDWHFGKGKNWKQTFTVDALPRVKMRLNYVCTFIDTVAETTLESTTTFYKLHVGTHVGFASVAADGSSLTMVHNIQRSLHVHKYT